MGWGEVLAAIWGVWTAISIITGGGPVEDTPYTVKNGGREPFALGAGSYQPPRGAPPRPAPFM